MFRIAELPAERNGCESERYVLLSQLPRYRRSNEMDLALEEPTK